MRLVILQRLRDVAGNDRGKAAWLEHRAALVKQLFSEPAPTWVVVQVGEGAYGSTVATSATEVLRAAEPGVPVVVVELRSPVAVALERYRLAAARRRPLTSSRHSQ